MLSGRDRSAATVWVGFTRLDPGDADDEDAGAQRTRLVVAGHEEMISATSLSVAFTELQASISLPSRRGHFLMPEVLDLDPVPAPARVVAGGKRLADHPFQAMPEAGGQHGLGVIAGRRGQIPVTGALPDAWAGDGDNDACNLAARAKGRTR